MNDLQKFMYSDHEVRIVVKHNEPWFVAADVCKALEVGNNRQAIARLDDDEKGVILTDTPGGKQEMSIVNEPGLYSLVLNSRKPEAKAFKRWVTHEVIPAIRKHGAYMTPETIEKTLTDPDFLIRLATELKKEKEMRLKLESENAVMLPKAEYCDAVLRSDGLIATYVIAKDYGMSAQAFNKLLERLGVQYRRDKVWTLKAQYQDKGYMQSQTYHPEGSDTYVPWSYWREEGRKFLYEHLKSHGILPVSERNKRWQTNVI